MENKEDKKELQDIIDEISGVAKDLVDEYVSGEEKYVSEDEQAKLNEKQIRTPYKDDDIEAPFKVLDEEMDHLMKVQTQIKEVLKKEPDIYIQGEGRKVDVLKYCQKVGYDKFNILEYIGVNKERLRACLKIKTTEE